MNESIWELGFKCSPIVASFESFSNVLHERRICSHSSIWLASRYDAVALLTGSSETDSAASILAFFLVLDWWFVISLAIIRVIGFFFFLDFELADLLFQVFDLSSCGFDIGSVLGLLNLVLFNRLGPGGKESFGLYSGSW